LKEDAKFTCNLYNKSFTRSATLRDHIRTHSNERPFKCLSCPKSFTRLKDKNRHQALHTGEKKFICKGRFRDGSTWGCGNMFGREDGLVAHFRSDSGWTCIQRFQGMLLNGRDTSFDDGKGEWVCQSALTALESATGCGHLFITRLDLRVHLMSTGGAKCLRSFVQQEATGNARQLREQDIRQERAKLGQSQASSESHSITISPSDPKVKVLRFAKPSGIPGDILEVGLGVPTVYKDWAPFSVHFGTTEAFKLSWEALVSAAEIAHSPSLPIQYTLKCVVPRTDEGPSAPVPVRLRLNVSGNISFVTCTTLILGHYPYADEAAPLWSTIALSPLYPLSIEESIVHDSEQLEWYNRYLDTLKLNMPGF
jgi:hypothetical protein